MVYILKGVNFYFLYIISSLLTTIKTVNNLLRVLV
nr:MAG TPA: hypothetical protein [Caudoviricetes sp.]